VLDAGDALQRRRELVVAKLLACGRELVEHELQPELGRLMLDDEQQLVVMEWVAERALRRQQGGEIEVAAVAHPIREVGDDRILDRTGVPFDAVAHGHSLCRPISAHE
jgi:hypothetical protein